MLPCTSLALHGCCSAPVCTATGCSTARRSSFVCSQCDQLCARALAVSLRRLMRPHELLVYCDNSLRRHTHHTRCTLCFHNSGSFLIFCA
ncbi:hypothetical protein MT325_m096R [Paramecium bursaria chlorella virus MT325]|uniref:Uncharacterized protein m096R n=1 Tax=Paramecium bursaria Chlorella virus MT325 TaxID=346932 RepID=A7ITH6_PBCVM|nr:hypothetical protein MT325_m096R [Paramecium bursaria chlorella virus MT325]